VDLREQAGSAAPRRRARLPGVALRLALVVVLVAAILAIQGAATYRVPGGAVTYRLEPAWPGGRLVMPLGPAGEFSLRTHRTPFDIVMAYRLPAETASLTGQGSVVGDLPGLQKDARAAFVRYLESRIPWLLLAGAAGGALIAGSWPRRRRLLWGALAGMAAAGAVVSGVAGVTYLTIDRSPAVEYRGLARNVPRVLPLVRALGAGGQADNLRGLQDFVDGLESVAMQLTVAPILPERRSVVRLLLVSDVHDNLFGTRAAARLAAGGGDPVDGVLLAGDITDRGTRQEAELFLRAFGGAGTPKVLVGGNHEAAAALAAFARGGVRVLGDAVAEVGGVRVFGAGDPLSSSPQVESDPALLAADSLRIASVWPTLQPPVQVLLVHDLRQATGTIALARDAGEDVVVAYGNDHVAGVTRDGSVTLVDAGTAGASGYQAIGSASPGTAGTDPEEPAPESRDLYTFQLLDFSRTSPPRPVGVTTLSYAGDGRIAIAYVPLDK
jgi:predicted phosphodiesterase